MFVSICSSSMCPMQSVMPHGKADREMQIWKRPVYIRD